MTAQPSDGDLVTAAQAGDRGALDTLLRRHYDRIHAVCSQIAGSTRDGGSYEARMGGVACWNAVMDENEYMVKKWNEFIAA